MQAGVRASREIEPAQCRPGCRRRRSPLPHQDRSARQASRTAISANPIGSASCPTHAGHVGGDDGACFALGDDELNGATGENRRHARRDRRGKHGRRPDERCRGWPRLWRAPAVFLARGNRRAEETNPECEVLNERTGSGDADAEQTAHGDLERAATRPSRRAPARRLRPRAA